MTIKQQGGVFGRNPTFNDVTVESDLVSKTLTVDGGTLFVDAGNNRVGVNNTAPDTVLHLKASGGTETSIKLQNTSGSADGPWLLSAGQPGLGNTGFSIYDVANARSSFHVNSAGDARVTAGNLIIGTSGKGIDFSATSGTGTSELFNDYEEGTWTPEVADAQTGGNTATGTFTGYYTKIGRMVNLMFVLQNIDTTGMSASAILYFRNFPFASSSLTGAQRALSCVHFDSGVTFDTSAIYTAEIPDSYTWGRISECISGSTRDFIRVSDITSGSNAINLQFNYYA